jgi:hypothetical protein
MAFSRRLLGLEKGEHERRSGALFVVISVCKTDIDLKEAQRRIPRVLSIDHVQDTDLHYQSPASDTSISTVSG